MAGASKTITLISSDGQSFEVPEAAAMLSLTIKNIVDDGCGDEPIPLAEVDAETLSIVVEYLKHGAGKVTAEEKSQFDAEFVSGADFGVLFKCILASNYLDIQGLLDFCAAKIADLMKNKSVEKIREIFNIACDFTPEEEAAIRKDHEWAHEGADIEST